MMAVWLSPLLPRGLLRVIRTTVLNGINFTHAADNRKFYSAVHLKQELRSCLNQGWNDKSVFLFSLKSAHYLPQRSTRHSQVLLPDDEPVSHFIRQTFKKILASPKSWRQRNFAGRTAWRERQIDRGCWNSRGPFLKFSPTLKLQYVQNFSIANLSFKKSLPTLKVFSVWGCCCKCRPRPRCFMVEISSR